ncbi:uncharacterized protein LOC124845430 [Vigna umbellata]|uniref:uncharacterized protein LOC124845430 n=1 Tax=Vigna umbellata TaxID=87088 RepID=UPI001F5EA892|nr:uncharacterized protein LOC124845430 [Vigna umbellata]
MAKRKNHASKKLTKRQMTEKYQNNGKVPNSHPTKKRGRPLKTSQFLETHTTVSSSSDPSASTFDGAPPSPMQGVQTPCTPQPTNSDNSYAGIIVEADVGLDTQSKDHKPIHGVHTPCTPQTTNSDNSYAGHIVEADVGLETQSKDHKPMLQIDGQGFLPSRLAAKGIGDIITRHYTDPWPSWRKIPARTRDSMFEEFLTKFSVSPPDYRSAKRNFQMRASIVMTSKLLKARTTLDKPNWIEDGVWEKLCEHWKSEGFKSKSAQAKTNRASNYAASHTGGSISASQHRANMIKETGIAPTPLELYRRLHQHKDNTWVDSRSKNLNEAFIRTMKQLTKSALAQGKPPPNELDVWSDVARSKKGKVYGLGEKYAAVGGGQCPHGSSSSMLITKEFGELGVESTEVRGGQCNHRSSSPMELIIKQEVDEPGKEMEEVRKESELQTKGSNTERHCSSSSMELITKQDVHELRREIEEIRKERDELKTKVSNTERHGSSSSMELITKREFDELRRDLEEVKKERDELHIKVSNTEKLIEENNALIRQMMETINDQSMLSIHSRGKSKLR